MQLSGKVLHSNTIIFSVLRRTKALLRRTTALDMTAYWNDRTALLGRRSVIQVGHSDDEYEAFTERQWRLIESLLSPHLSGGEKVVLDYGCGNGRFSAPLQRLTGATVIAADISKKNLELAEPYQDVEYRLIRDGRIPLTGSSADLVFIFSVPATTLHRLTLMRCERRLPES